MPPRSSAMSAVLAEIGKRGLETLVAGLSPVEKDSELERACRTDAARVQRELVRVVSFSAFHLLAEARGLVPAVDEDALEAFGGRFTRELTSCFEVGAALAARL